MRGIVNILLFLISLTGPIAMAMLVLGADRNGRRRNILIGIMAIAFATFVLATYLEMLNLPPSGTGSETGPQDAPAFSLANAVLAGIVYLIIWAVCRGIASIRRYLRERYPAQAPMRMNRAQRRSADRISRRR
jgi:MFS family permease